MEEGERRDAVSVRTRAAAVQGVPYVRTHVVFQKEGSWKINPHGESGAVPDAGFRGLITNTIN